MSFKYPPFIKFLFYCLYSLLSLVFPFFLLSLYFFSSLFNFNSYLPRTILSVLFSLLSSFHSLRLSSLQQHFLGEDYCVQQTVRVIICSYTRVQTSIRPAKCFVEKKITPQWVISGWVNLISLGTLIMESTWIMNGVYNTVLRARWMN